LERLQKGNAARRERFFGDGRAMALFMHVSYAMCLTQCRLMECILCNASPRRQSGAPAIADVMRFKIEMPPIRKGVEPCGFTSGAS
jgi:hypothetical protein